jgi:hypothetical protein
MMGLLIAECLQDETALDRAALWSEDEDGFAAAPLLSADLDDDDVQLPAWERSSFDWLEVRFGALRAVFSEE